MEHHDSERVINKLFDVVGEIECPICHKFEFVPINGFVQHSLFDEPEPCAMIVGPTVTCVAVACKNCGFISHHLVQALENRANKHD